MTLFEKERGVVGVAAEHVGKLVGMAWYELGQMDLVNGGEKVAHDFPRAHDELVRRLADLTNGHGHFCLTRFGQVGRIAHDHVEVLIVLFAHVQRTLVVVVDEVVAVHGEALVEFEHSNADALTYWVVLEFGHLRMAALLIQMVVESAIERRTRKACDVKRGRAIVRASSES